MSSPASATTSPSTTLGVRRERHADRYLKPPEEMHRLFARYPEALARTLEIAERCRFSLDELAYQYPEERDDPGADAAADAGAADLGGRGRALSRGPARRACARTLEHELRLIEKLGYAPYFLTVNCDRALRPLARTSSARGAARPPTRRSATCSASPRSIPSATTCCSSASSPRSAASRPTSTSTSSTSGARSSCSGSSTPTAATAPRSARP